MNFFRKPSFFSAGTVLALGLATGLVGVACGGELAVFERYPLISAPSMPTPPVIDGDLTEAEWQTAAVLGPLSTWPSGVSDEARQTVYVGYDADHLYLGFRIRRPDAAVTPQMPTKTGRVDDWESGDMVEIALDVDHDGADYFGFALYPNGAFADGVGAPGMNSHWDADWRQAASLTDTGWQGEMAIPFSSLGLSGPPSPGTFWGFDFIDNQRTPAKRVMMSGYRGGNWHHLENLGHLRFGAPGEPAVRYRRFEGVGPDRTLAEFEIVNPADVSATLDAKLELMRRKAGSGVGGKSFYDQVESGADTAYAEGKSEFEKSTELGELVDEALSHYERVDGGLLTDSLTVPAGQRRTLGMLRSAGNGEMLLRHEARNAGGELLAGMVRLVKVEPPLSLSI